MRWTLAAMVSTTWCPLLECSQSCMLHRMAIWRIVMVTATPNWTMLSLLVISTSSNQLCWLESKASSVIRFYQCPRLCNLSKQKFLLQSRREAQWLPRRIKLDVQVMGRTILRKRHLCLVLLTRSNREPSASHDSTIKDWARRRCKLTSSCRNKTLSRGHLRERASLKKLRSQLSRSRSLGSSSSASTNLKRRTLAALSIHRRMSRQREKWADPRKRIKSLTAKRQKRLLNLSRKTRKRIKLSASL